MEWIENRSAREGLSSTSSLPTLADPSNSDARSSSAGAYGMTGLAPVSPEIHEDRFAYSRGSSISKSSSFNFTGFLSVFMVVLLVSLPTSR